MKKQFIPLFIICDAIMAISINCYAQQAANDSNFKLNLSLAAKIPDSNFGRHSFHVDHMSEINIRAVREFTKMYNQARDIQWYKDKNELTVHFTEKGIKCRADYSRNGDWLFTMRSYSEDHLPKEVRTVVKKEYFDFSITWINEIVTEKQTIYVLHMQDKDSWKNVRVCDGEMSVIEERSKK
jgi:hypothetical protein